MRLRPLSPLLLFVFAAMAAHAQVGVYGMFTADHMTGISYSNAAGSGSDGKISPIGGTLGVFYNWRTFGPVKLGADLRVSSTSSRKSAYPDSVGAGGRIYMGLAGVRAVFHTPIVPLRPYVQGSAGLARTNFGTDYSHDLVSSSATSTQPGILLSNTFAYQAMGGVDLSLLPMLDFRVVEIGIGGIGGTSAHPGNHPLGSLSTGLVFHLPF